ncbi:hypothetical protein CERSUDRAFT_121692 [Gelatoporia subvermispora B]|uniref:Aminopeptidase P N-terminal domain-containing protein n=1 Tax=Ceriporiopsis subvermispora (strain B) TaxID=914234 RepID=M2QVK9_CERS8|nr:hypothetical protein CERSUDRAFT_121692 [Gelatoporia subvermispora B]
MSSGALILHNANSSSPVSSNSALSPTFCLEKRISVCHPPRRELSLWADAHHDVKPSPYGQPLYPSHPHLLKKDEITPGIPAAEYERRRRELIASLPANSVVLCLAGEIKYMSGQIFYKFRQRSDFWYLTGFEQPGAAVVLESALSTPRGYRMTIFCAENDLETEKWEGARMAHEDVVRVLGADDARPFHDLARSLRALASGADYVYTDIPGAKRKSARAEGEGLLDVLKGKMRSKAQEGLLKMLDSSKTRSLAPEVARLRVIKSVHEQKVMRDAADISAEAHTRTMRFAQPDMSEHVIAAHFEYLCARAGAQRPAYVPVVASGANARIIHYTANNQVARDGELILIDAGCEYNGYASDITRTFPVSGTFTDPQKALYAAVLSAQKHLVKLCNEAAGLSLAQLHSASCDVLRKELVNAGIPEAPLRISQLYPHYIGHHVGIDLHESNYTDRHEPLKTGMVVTVEPGVYVPPSPSYPSYFHDIGIRIEDEVLVGEKEPVVLSAHAPKELADVEGTCQGLLGIEPL